jgi:hypothetical protein
VRLQSESTSDVRDHGSLMPTRRAMARVDQCVSPSDCVSSVRVIIASTASSLTRRGVPLRGASTNPSSRCSRKRCRQVMTLWRLTLSRAAIAMLVASGSASAASTIRARITAAWLAPRRRTRRHSDSRSSTVRTSTAAFGLRAMTASYQRQPILHPPNLRKNF